ncbi:MAG: NAD-dependent epimerase/dehydratase family protein [Candidatus Gottesmanbacteria bacterium]
MKNILVTGAFGQIGSELVPALQTKFGMDHVVAIGHHTIPKDFKGIVETAEIGEGDKIESIIKKYSIDTVYHLVSLLSAKGEIDPSLTWQINMGGLKTILDLAVTYKLKVFWPSSIAAFGPTTPRVNTPQRTVLEPTTMYGVTKVAGELLVAYYVKKFGIDIRSVRYPGIISWKTPPGGGTTDYAVAIFYEGLQKGKYECFVRPDTTLPMMYMDDAVRGTMELMEADPIKLTVRTSYNLAAISFTAEDLAKEINKHLKVDVTYKPDFHQAIADSWPESIDDATARNDWGWKHEYTLEKMTTVMIEELKKKLV